MNISGRIVKVELPKADKPYLVTIAEASCPLTLEEAKYEAGEDAKPSQVMAILKASKMPSYKNAWIAKGILAKSITGDKATASPRVIEEAKGIEISFSFLAKGATYQDAQGEDKTVTDGGTLVDYNTLVIL